MTVSALKITDGTTTVDFSTGNQKLISYHPLVSLDNLPITESARVNLVSTSATNTATIHTINRLLEQARNYAMTETGPRVYIEFDPGTSGTAWRSMLLLNRPGGSSKPRCGRVELEDSITGILYSQAFIITIEWTRQPFWEGALTAVPLTNSSASDVTSAGIAITNCNDGGTVQIETATVVGPIDPAGAGNADFVLTAAGMTGTPITTSVAVANDDTGAQVATKAATAMNLDSDITDRFNIAASTADIVITRLIPTANDATLNLAYDNDTCSGLTPDATSADTTAGSATDNENWVSIKPADVIGDLPAPIKLQMYNSKSGSNETDEIWVHHNVYSDPANLAHFIEGEDATGATVTDIADGTSCAGFHAQLDYTATVETLVAQWLLTTAEISYMAGGRFGILARWATAFPYPASMWLRLKLTTNGTNTVLWEGQLSIIPDARKLHLLDVLRLPPYLAGQANLKGINLRLYALRNVAGAHSFALDYLQLSPISGDNGWKRFLSVEKGADGILYQEYFTHDETEGITYHTDTSSKIISDFVNYGGSILLVPNTVQKLQFLTVDINGNSKITQTWTLKLWYRPRRNAL